jgi:hypothetical protein
MDIIIITSIVVAVFGAVALAWVLSQNGSPGGTAEAAEAVPDEATLNPEAAASPDAAALPDAPIQPEPAARPDSAVPKAAPAPQRSRTPNPERSAFDGLADFAAPEADLVVPPIEPVPTPKSPLPETGPITSLNARPAKMELEAPGNPLRLNATDLIAAQIELLYEEYVRLDDERSRLAQDLLTNMLFEKIERTAGRLDIVTEQSTLDLRKQLIKVSGEYERTQFRLGSLQHLNARLGDPRVAHQIEELVMTVRALARER